MTPDTLNSDDGLMAALGAAVEGKICAASGCQTNPITTRGGDAVCAWHRDLIDHGTFGQPCERCASREWIEAPDAEYVATCVHCDYATYNADVLEGSW